MVEDQDVHYEVSIQIKSNVSECYVVRELLRLISSSVSGRHESEDEVRLDFCKGCVRMFCLCGLEQNVFTVKNNKCCWLTDANDNTWEILTNICRKEGLTEGKRFNYLNEFVKLLIKLEGYDGLDYSIEELQCW